MSEPSTYTGRFAPSPSGPLHFGSLVAAVSSYLDARANNGRWLIRMEDLDPTREPPGTADRIVSQLNDFGMNSDLPILYQSTRIPAYEKVLQTLLDKNLVFRCCCSRQQLKAMGGRYNGKCRTSGPAQSKKYAMRLKTENSHIEFEDKIQGASCPKNVLLGIGDFIIKRKDNLFAYQLAVVVDDSYQQITHVVRGADLLDSTPRQIYLQQLLGYVTPSYAHIPIAVNEYGQKLSKQHFAEPLDIKLRRNLMHETFIFLGLNPPTKNSLLEVTQQLQWGIRNWDIQKVPKLANIPQHALGS